MGTPSDPTPGHSFIPPTQLQNSRATVSAKMSPTTGRQLPTPIPKELQGRRFLHPGSRAFWLSSRGLHWQEEGQGKGVETQRVWIIPPRPQLATHFPSHISGLMGILRGAAMWNLPLTGGSVGGTGQGREALSPAGAIQEMEWSEIGASGKSTSAPGEI